MYALSLLLSLLNLPAMYANPGRGFFFARWTDDDREDADYRDADEADDEDPDDDDDDV